MSNEIDEKLFKQINTRNKEENQIIDKNFNKN